MDKRTENALTIGAALGLPAEQALELLHKTIEVLSTGADRGSLVPARTAELLSRTFDTVNITDKPTGRADLVIGWGQPSGAKCGLTATCQHGVVTAAPDISGKFDTAGLGIGQQTIAACYIASAATRLLVPGIADNDAWPLEADLRHFAVTPPGKDNIDVGDAYLVGSGAIGNGFVWALEGGLLRGKLTLVDGDHVSDGNLQRNVLCHEADVKTDTVKVEVLARYLRASQPDLTVDPQAERTEEFFAASGDALRIPRLISAVDSPRARRELQKWLPREVFDASTSGIQEVIFHHNVHPLRHACLECIYPFTAAEKAHEQHVADALGVPLEALSEGLISQARAEQIIQKYPKLRKEDVVGEAYDSLFKRMCGAGLLSVGEGKRVLAPLAFVSVLAGAILAVEFQKRVAGQEAPGFNFWRLSPWAAPRVALRRLLPKQATCRFCSDELTLQTMAGIWGPV